MNVTGTLPSGFKNSIINIELIVDSPYSGFEVSLMESGKFHSSKLITFSGSEGAMFDQSGNFFGGYKSGSALDLKVHYDYSRSGFAYYFEDTLIANNLDATGVSDGATDGSINAVSFKKHGNSTVSVVADGDARTSLSKECIGQIESRITESTSIADNGSMLVNFTDPNGTLTAGGFNAVRSESFWAKDIDFTAVSVWNNRGYDTPVDFRKRGATAITKRHVIMAKHFKLQASDVLYFTDPDGNWVSRTISAIADHATADITVGVLDEALPDNITPVKIIPSNINDYFNVRTAPHLDIKEGYKPLAFRFSFEKEGLLIEISKINSSTKFVSYTATVPSPFDNLSEALLAGTSGQPVFLLIDGEAVLVTSLYTTLTAPSYASYISNINDLIDSADSAASISTNLVVTEAKLPLTTYYNY